MGKEPPAVLADRELIERHVARVVVKPQILGICLIPTSAASAQAENPSLTDSAPGLHSPAMIALPWTAPSFGAMKGILHEPGPKPTMICCEDTMRQASWRDPPGSVRESVIRRFVPRKAARNSRKDWTSFWNGASLFPAP
jgi:hypothetical protein